MQAILVSPQTLPQVRPFEDGLSVCLLQEFWSILHKVDRVVSSIMLIAGFIRLDQGAHAVMTENTYLMCTSLAVS